MNARTQGSLTIKLSVESSESPDLFLALSQIADPRRRTGRLRALASKGLMMEVVAGDLKLCGEQSQDATNSQPATAKAKAPKGNPPRATEGGVSVSAMVDWADDE